MANENVEITVFGSAGAQAAYDTRDEGRVVDVVRNQVVPREKAEYQSVKVKVRRKPDGSPDHLVVYMLRKDTYLADVVRVDVDDTYEVMAYRDDYQETEDDEDEELAGEGLSYPPGVSFDFIAATPVPEIPSALEAVEHIHQAALNAGLKSHVLLGADATVANYRHYLASGLRGFVNVGHGFTGGIVLHDGTLGSAWFNGVPGMPLAPGVVYFNSCQVFNAPLQPAVMHAGARTYVGGIVNLLIGASEKVAKCFWDSAMKSNTPMGLALKNCEKNVYPTQGAHGISGDLGAFNFVSAPIDEYKVVLYGEDAIPGDLVAFIHCYHNGSNVMSCEFYRDGAALPENRFKGGRVGLVYPYSHFDEILDVLRNEKPLYYGLILSTKVGYIATRAEPVGEGSDKS